MTPHRALAIVSLSTLAFSCALTGCGGDDPPPETPVAPLPPPPATVQSTPASVQSKDDQGTEGQVSIDRDIRDACGITEPEALFAFNSARVRAGDHPVLDQLATCFTSGPLAGRSMRLVGHADPRGDEEYNMVLGERRANGVKTYLVNAGLNANQSETTSRGEMDAQGTDEASWTRDRRVDVMLVDQ
jgi:peptidoglycan-associated lipoprotein